MGVWGMVWSGFDLDRMRQMALQRYGAAAAEAVDVWRKGMASWRELPEEEQLQRVNEFFNRRIRFAEDIEVWGQADYWATPLETMGRGAGDCEDFVFAKYFALRELGVAEHRDQRRVRLVVELHHLLALHVHVPRVPEDVREAGLAHQIGRAHV